MEYKIKLTNAGNIKNPNKNVFYIGRPSVYSNPFPTKPSTFSDEIYDLDTSLYKFRTEKLPKIDVSELVTQLLEKKEIVLSCFCTNKLCLEEITHPVCHGELIAEKVYKELKLELKKQQKLHIGITGHANIEKTFSIDDFKELTTNIPAFRNEYDFLSNMYKCNIILDSKYQKDYPYLILDDSKITSVEYIYQYLKSDNPEYKMKLLKYKEQPHKIKSISNEVGKKYEFSESFIKHKYDIMKLLVKLKFEQNNDLLLKLLNTGMRKIIEYNNWNDTYWGVSKGKGENNLGKILMELRNEFQYKIDYYNIDIYNKVYDDISFMINRILRDKGLSKKNIILISGMARGVDEIMADYAIKNNIPLILSIPNSIKWHKDRPPRKDGTRAQAIKYEEKLEYIKKRKENGDKLSEIVEVKKTYKSPYNDEIFKYANFARNQHMIDISDVFISYKRDKSVGTDHAIENAKKSKKYYGNCNDKFGLPNLIKPFNIKYETDLFEHDTHVLIHGCNCFNTMGKGIALYIKNNFPEAYKADQKTKKGDRTKLGTFTYADVNPNNIKGKPKYVVNLYSQYTYFDKNDMFDINAYKNGLYNIIKFFIDKRTKSEIPIKFSLPPIGLGLANGDIVEIYNVLKEINNLFIDKNIMVDLCLHKNDRHLSKKFKQLEQNINKNDIENRILELKKIKM